MDNMDVIHMNAARIRNVIFDFGGVLVRWSPREIVTGLYADETLRAKLISEIFQHPDWLELDRGTLSEDEAAKTFATRVGRPVDEMAALLVRARESLTLIPETVALLQDLSAAGIPVYGLSNMAAKTFEFLRARDPHWSLFRGTVISGEIKMVKPDAEIFEHIAKEHGLEPAESLFLDDLQANIDAAKRAGFQVMLFDDPPRRCQDLRELFKLP
jgi:putative hydrolase of the HAD superfamily